MENYKYKFSVVMPVYNVELFLKEAIESVINQTLGFEKNIQLILVNDGSKDNSEKICLEYQKKYPENIKYIYQKNSGVSSARNNGMQYIEGKYVNFLDSDDKWELDAFEKIWNFFEDNEEEVDLIACRMKFFDAQDNFHKLDYKFEKNKVQDIFENYNCINLHITSSIIKSKVAKNFKFDTNLKYGEDSKYVNEIILEKHKYGTLNKTMHYYRKRSDESSTVQNKEKSLEWYTTTIELFYKSLMNLSIQKYGEIIPYIQYLIMYDIQFRAKNIIPKNIGDDEKKQYFKDIIEILNQIEDYIILEQKNINADYKMYFLSLKYGKDITKCLKYKKGRLYFNNISIYKIKNNGNIVIVDIFNINKNKILIEGRINCPLSRELFEIYAYINSEKKILIKLEEAKKSLDGKNTYAFDNSKVMKLYTFKIEIPLEDLQSLSFLFSYKNLIDNKVKIKFSKISNLSDIKWQYVVFENYILKYIRNNIRIYKNTYLTRLKSKLKYFRELIKIKEYKVIFYRGLYYINKLFNHKEIWLISDREERADDNGEHLFKYVENVKNKNIKAYYVLQKNSKDYKRVRKIGKIVEPNSVKYKVLFLLSSKIISSQANDNVINVFEQDEKYYRDLMKFKFVFLQHGISKNNLSKWLKKQDKNIRIFVTAAKKEYESFINGDYYYTENEIKLTGFPRFDNLKDNREKRIIIAPTQRKKLVEWNQKDSYGKTYNPYFKNSEFYIFYNKLINDERILEVLKKYKYKMKFVLHPLLIKQREDFQENDVVEIVDEELNYQEEFARNALLITDYSSVEFDFAYLKKPIIYTQFDKNSFYEGQVYEKGYYDYERDGFGPVCYNYEDTVNEIIKCIENDCKIQDIYLKRIENFYAYYDKNNCKRVYEEILKV